MNNKFDLPKRLPVVRVRAGSRFWRVHGRGREALWFGPRPGRPPLNRFDDPKGEFRVCYMGQSIEVCFAETFLRNPPVRILSLTDLQERVFSELATKAELRLVPLYGAALARMGVTADLAIGDDYEKSQAWARAIWEHADTRDGVIYRPRHDDSAKCIAIFDRVSKRWKVTKESGVMQDEQRLRKLLHRYRLSVTA